MGCCGDDDDKVSHLQLSDTFLVANPTKFVVQQSKIAQSWAKDKNKR